MPMNTLADWENLSKTPARGRPNLDFPPEYADASGVLDQYLPMTYPNRHQITRTRVLKPSGDEYLMLEAHGSWDDLSGRLMAKLEFLLREASNGNFFLKAYSNRWTDELNFGGQDLVRFNSWEVRYAPVVGGGKPKELVGYLIFDECDKQTHVPTGVQYKASWRWIN